MKKLFAKKVIAAMMLVVMSVVMFSGCSNKEEEKGTKTIKIGVQDTDISAIVAYKKGYFDEVMKDKGLDAKVELVMFDAGPAIMEAFSANSLDFGCLGDQPCISAIATGCPAEIIGTYRTQKTGTAIIARKEAGINSTADLRGKKIGLTLGSNAEHLLNIVLEDAGLTQEDVEIIALEQGDMLTTLESAQIDAAAVWEPRIQQSKEFTFRLADGEGTYDVDGNKTKDIAFKYFCNPFAANTAFTSKNPEMTSAVLEALSMGAAYTDENTEDAINILAEYTGVDASVASASVNCEDRNVAITDEKIEAFKATIDFLISSGQLKTDDENCIIKSADDIDKFINTSYYEDAGIK